MNTRSNSNAPKVTMFQRDLQKKDQRRSSMNGRLQRTPSAGSRGSSNGSNLKKRRNSLSSAKSSHSGTSKASVRSGNSSIKVGMTTCGRGHASLNFQKRTKEHRKISEENTRFVEKIATIKSTLPTN